MSGANHYEVLGVSPTASADDIRSAYRNAARARHPDAGGSADEMQRLNAAWQVLRDPGRRAVYDRALAGRDRGIDGAVAPPSRGPGEPPPPGEEWAGVAEDLLDSTPYGPTAALEGWLALLPPAALMLAVALLVGAFLFTSPALIVFSGAAFFVAFGLFVLAPMLAMTRRRSEYRPAGSSSADQPDPSSPSETPASSDTSSGSEAPSGPDEPGASSRSDVPPSGDDAGA
jgi:curved DNA-binding protein CbpA